MKLITGEKVRRDISPHINQAEIMENSTNDFSHTKLSSNTVENVESGKTDPL